jgi:hypothetical protein
LRWLKPKKAHEMPWEIVFIAGRLYNKLPENGTEEVVA